MKKIFLFFAAFFLMGIIFLFGMVAEFNIKKSIVSPLPFPTGKEVYEALNVYRAENSLPPLDLDSSLCNNLVQRWEHYRAHENHDGLDEWGQKYLPGRRVAEILVAGESAQIMVKKWSESPGHDLMIKENSKVCVYTADGLAVAMLSK